jgi:hypothetical protein
MPLFLKANHAVLYIHVPKTGGTAVEAFFAANGFRTEYLDTGGPASLNRFRRCAPQHMHAEQIKAIFRPLRLDYVFMTVREPLARLLSEYKMHLRGKESVAQLDEWFDQMCKRYQEDSYIAENHFRPQCEFWMPGCEVYKQEEGFECKFIERLEAKTGLTLDVRQLGAYNKDEVTQLETGAISRVSARVAQFYRKDYLMFNYELANT